MDQSSSARSGLGPFVYLRRLLDDLDAQTEQIIWDRDVVQRRYGQLFHPDNLGRLRAEDFVGFLHYENNRHWWGIHRHQAVLVSDMDRLRHGLAVLMDEDAPVADRLNRLMPRSGPRPVPGLGKAVATPVLHVVYPDRYGVWNAIAESAMNRLELWPEFVRGAGFGERYVAVNDELLRCAEELAVDLWTLDALWWRVEREHDPTHHQFEGGLGAEPSWTSTRPGHQNVTRTFICQTCHLEWPLAQRANERPQCVDCAG
jgi:hypothetical protein